MTKIVTGNQGSKDKHFKITVKLTNNDDLIIHNDDTFQLSGNYEKTPEKSDGTLYESDEMAANNITSIKYSQLKEGYSFYLHSGSNVEIKGIPSGLGYEITEYQEKYSPSFEIAGDTKTGDKEDEGTDIAASEGSGDTSDLNTYKVSDTYLKSTTNVRFTNNKAGVIPSGVLMTVAGSAAIAALGVAGVAAGTIYLRKKKSEEE